MSSLDLSWDIARLRCRSSAAIPIGGSVKLRPESEICTAKAREQDVCFSDLVREYMELPECIVGVIVNYC